MTDGDGSLGAKSSYVSGNWILLGKGPLIPWLLSLFAPTTRYGL